MKKISVLFVFVVAAIVFTACSASTIIPDTNTMGVAQMGFIDIPTPGLPSGCTKALVSAQLGDVSVSDTADVYYDRDGQHCSVYGPDLVVKAYDQAKIKYQLPLGSGDLQTFIKKAKWTVKPL
jgi:hypothetical protein